MHTEENHIYYQLTRPVFLIGFMGAGKTSVAQYLAITCGLSSIDADEYLEISEDRSIARIFAEDGEDHFRDLETTYLDQLAHHSPRLIACGGGVVKRPQNIEIMREAGFVVWLQVSAEEAAARIPNTDSRPLFKNLDTARATLAERLALYEAAADYSIDTNGKSIPEVAELVKRILLDAGVLVETPADAS